MRQHQTLSILLLASLCALPLIGVPLIAQAQPAQTQPVNKDAPDTLSNEGMLRETVPMPFGELAEDCLEDKFALYFVLNLSRYGAPEDRRDTVIQYDPRRNTIHLAMFGGSKTTDAAKKRLESRKNGLDYAVKLCAKELNKPTKKFYSHIEMTYSQIDRERGEKVPLVRWFRGRWELL